MRAQPINVRNPNRRQPPPHLLPWAKATLQVSGISIDYLIHRSACRQREIVEMRWRAMYLLRTTPIPRHALPASYKTIAALLGLGDHTTVVSGLRRYCQLHNLPPIVRPYMGPIAVGRRATKGGAL